MFSAQNQAITQQIVHCSYEPIYQDTYETNYDTSFIFIDEEEYDDGDMVIETIPLPLSGQLCQRQTKSSRNTSNHHH